MRWLAFVLFWVVAATATRADEAVQRAPAPAWAAAPPSPAAANGPAAMDGAPIRFLLLDQQTRVDDAGEHTYIRYRMKVLSPVGLQAAGNFSVAWSPETQTLTVHGVSIQRGADSIDVLAAQDFTVLRREQQLETAMVTGVLTASLQASDLRVGDVLDVAYTISTLDPVLAGRAEQMLTAQSPVPVDQVRLVASWPSSRAIRARATDGWTLSPVRRVGPDSRVEITASNVTAVSHPEDSPLRFAMERQFELSEHRDWAAISSLMAPLYDRAMVLGEGSPVQAEIERIRRLSDDPAIQASAALRLVQDEIRYLALMMGEGGLTPASADDTWRNRYGDCKAKTALLLAILRGLGIDAVPAAVNLLGDDGLDTRLPMVGLFNHVLVRVEIGGRVLWLDGTRIGDRSLDDLARPQMKWALPLTRAGAALERIEWAAPSRPLMALQMAVDLSAGAYAPAKVTGEAAIRGDVAFATNAQLASVPVANRDQWLTAFWSTQMATLEVETVDTRYDSEAGELRMLVTGKASLNRDERGRFYAGGTSVPVAIPSPHEGPSSAVPHVVDPAFITKTATFVLPAEGAGFTVFDSDVDQTYLGHHYTRRSRLEGKTLTIDYAVRNVTGELSADEVRAGQETDLPWARMAVRVAPPPNYQATEADRAVWAADLPTDSAGFARRGELLSAARDEPGAMAAYERAIELDPTNANAIANRGILRFWRGDRDAAKADFDAAADIDPAERIAMNGAALVAMAEGRHQDAVVELSRALRQAPRDNFALSTRASAYLAQGQHDKALADIDNAIGTEPPTVYLGLRRATILSAAGRDDEALTTVEALARAHPQDTSVLQTQAVYLLDLDRAQAAREVLDKALAVSPDHEALLMLRGETLAVLGEDAAAMADFAVIRAESPDDAGRLNNICWALAVRRVMLEQALRDCDAALAIAADAPGILDSRALVLLQMGDTAGALAVYDRVLALSPRNASSLYGRGLAREALGRADEGAADKAAATAINPGVTESFAAYVAARTAAGTAAP